MWLQLQSSKGMHVFRFKAVESDVNGVKADVLGLVFRVKPQTEKLASVPFGRGFEVNELNDIFYGYSNTLYDIWDAVQWLCTGGVREMRCRGHRVEAPRIRTLHQLRAPDTILAKRQPYIPDITTGIQGFERVSPIQPGGNGRVRMQHIICMFAFGV